MKASELSKILAKVKPGLAGSELLEQATSFAFIDGFVVTYNDAVSVRVPVDIIDFTGAVEAEKLYAYLETLGDARIALKISGEKLIVKAGKSKASFVFEKEIKLPVEFEFSEDWVQLNDVEQFKEYLSFAALTAAKDLTVPALFNVYIDAERIQSSDGFRITDVRHTQELDSPIMFPANIVKDLVKYDIVEYQFSPDGNWVHFRTKDNTIFSIRLFGGEWVNTSNYLDLEDKKELRIPKNLKEPVSRAKIFTKGGGIGSEFVKLTFEGTSLLVEAFDETSTFQERVDLDEETDKVVIAVNPDFVLNILPKMKKATLVKDTFIRFKGDNWQHLVTLIKLA